MERTATWEWHDKASRVIIATYRNAWTWTDHHLVVDEITKLRHSTDASAFHYVISDMTRGTIPTGSPAASQYRDSGEDVMIVIVTKNLFIRTIAQMGIRMRGADSTYRIVASLEEAHQIIAEHQLQRQNSAQA